METTVPREARCDDRPESKPTGNSNPMSSPLGKRNTTQWSSRCN